MVRRSQRLSIFPASGGLHTANNPALIPIERLNDCNNIVFTTDASRKTRPASIRLDVSGIAGTANAKMVFDFWVNAVQKVVVIVDGKIYRDDGTLAFTDVTGVQTLTATDNVTKDVFLGLLMMAFENSVPMQLLHTGVLIPLTDSGPSSTVPNGTIIRTAKSAAWIAGVDGFPHRLHRSAFGDPLDWSGAGAESFDIDEGDGDPDGITAIFPEFFGDVYVAKRRSLYKLRLVGSTFSVSLALRGVGCISHNSVVAIQNDILFASERGIISLATTQRFGDVQTAFLSAPIHDIYNQKFNLIESKRMQAEYVPALNSYLLSAPAVGTNKGNQILGYNIINQQWYRWKSFSAEALGVYVNSSKQTQLLVGKSSGQLDVMDESVKSDYRTTGIPVTFRTGILFPLGSPDRSVSFKSLTVIYRPQGNSTFTVSARVDGLETNTLTFSQTGITGVNLGDMILGTDPLGSTGTVKVETLPLNSTGRGIQLTFTRTPTSGNINQGLEVLGYIIEFMDSEYSDKPSAQ